MPNARLALPTASSRSLRNSGQSTASRCKLPKISASSDCHVSGTRCTRMTVSLTASSSTDATLWPHATATSRGEYARCPVCPLCTFINTSTASNDCRRLLSVERRRREQNVYIYIYTQTSLLPSPLASTQFLQRRVFNNFCSAHICILNNSSTPISITVDPRTFPSLLTPCP